MGNYIDRLLACGVSLEDAICVINEFSHESDIDGLDEYCMALEQALNVDPL